MPKKKLLANTLIYSIGEVLPKLISFFLLPVFTLYLSSGDYGIISYTNSVLMFIFVLSSLALNTYLLRVYFDCKTERERKLLIGNVFSTIIIFNVFLLGLGFLFGPALVRYADLQIPFYPYFSLTILNNFLEIFAIIPLIVYRVNENAKTYVIINIARSLLLFFTTYTLIVHFKWGVLGNFYGRLFVNIAFTAIYIMVIYRRAILNLNLEQVKKSLKFSIPLIPGAIGYLLISMSDRIILERHVPLSQLGVYSVAYTIAFSLSVLVQGGYRAFEPEIYREYNKEGFVPFITRIHHFFMFAVFLGATTLALFSKDTLAIMTKGDFAEGYKLVPLILIGVVTTGQNAIIGSVIIAEQKTRLSSISTIAGGAASILFNIIMIPHWGVYSAALASAVAYIFMNAIIMYGMTLKFDFLRQDVTALLLFVLLSVSIIFFDNTKMSFYSISIKIAVLGALTLIFSLLYNIKLSLITQTIKELKKGKQP